MNSPLRLLTAVLILVVCIISPFGSSLSAADSIAPIKESQLGKVNTNWLAAHPRIRLGDDFVWPPFVFLDKKGVYSGISAGYVNLISEKTGLEILPVLGLSWSQVIEQIKTGEIDMLPAVVRSKEREKFLNFTKPYISYPVVIATHSDGGIVADLSDLSERKTGVVKGYITHELLEQDFPEMDLVPFKSLAAGLHALESREIEALVDNLGAITYEMRRLRLSHIKIAAPTKYKFELSMAVRKDWPELRAILDKTLDDISTKEKSTIENTWLAVKVNFGINLTTILMWLIPLGASALIVIGVIVVWNRRLQQEITFHKKTKEELQLAKEGVESLNIELESRVKEEVEKRLDHERMMIQQAKMAAMGEMIGAIAHQWKQPLNSLGIVVQDIEEAFNYDEMNLEYIQNTVNRSNLLITKMSDTIDDFRVFFRPDREKQEFPLVKSITLSLNLLEASLNSNNINPELQLEELSVNGFQGEFSQVIVNLITNAKEALLLSKKKEKNIWITLKKGKVGNAIIIVRDNAGGIPKENLEKIFDSYFTTKEEQKGTGLGLYLARKIIEEHFDGSITASNTDDGTKFIITLPAS